jgi:hypothetical protein
MPAVQSGSVLSAKVGIVQCAGLVTTALQVRWVIGGRSHEDTGARRISCWYQRSGRLGREALLPALWLAVRGCVNTSGRPCSRCRAVTGNRSNSRGRCGD